MGTFEVKTGTGVASMGSFLIDPYLSLIHLFRNPAKACSETAGLNPKSKSSGPSSFPSEARWSEAESHG